MTSEWIQLKNVSLSDSAPAVGIIFFFFENKENF